jgi:hypothetical protein
MTVREDAVLPDGEVLKASINGVKRILHHQEWMLKRHVDNKTFDVYEFAARGADIARKIIKLNKIILQLQAMHLKAEYLRVVASK